MNWYSNLYWLTRLDSLNKLFSVVAALCGVVLILFYVFSYTVTPIYEEEKTKIIRFKRFARLFIIPLFIAASLGLLFVPTKNEMILIWAGGKAGEFIEQDSSLNKIPKQSAEYLSKLLQQQIDKLETKSDKP